MSIGMWNGVAGIQAIRAGITIFLCLLAPVLCAQTTVEYIHTDALGSPVAVTNQAGEVIERYDYEPYGAVIGKPNYQGIGFTGHVQDAATGLTYMQQRYYDPICGCFLSVDPVMAYDDPVNYFHRYRYAGNNPYRFTDPDGRCWIFCDFLPLPRGDRTNPHAPIPGADRGDALLVGGAVVVATVGATAGLAVTVGAPAMVATAAESASLQTGLVAQQGLNAASNTAAAIGAAAAGTVEADIVRGAYVSAAANMEKITDAVSSYVVPGPPAMTPAGAAAGLGSAVVGEIEQVQVAPPPPPPDPTIHR
ncbi:RHS repeat-associated core domain-containing protein [Pseudoxanthomonas putridarboris]|uniref:RHS repeat-associated core domain-containing protein n=1 Tax=Pseudoxanthomonas putridarboris TaxID=752605 RepID=A0ABU9J0N2_9GAMM